MDYRIIIKLLLTSIIIVAISEIGKRSSTFGAILASLPLTSLLALTWLYLDTHDRSKVGELSMGIFWAVIPSLAFFPILVWLLRTSLSYGIVLLLACVATAVLYWLYFLLMKQFGIRL